MLKRNLLEGPSSRLLAPIRLPVGRGANLAFAGRRSGWEFFPSVGFFLLEEFRWSPCCIFLLSITYPSSRHPSLASFAFF